ncbi:MAG: tectonin domain-containing protein [Cyanobacteria bacterium P01_F01_bin.53]
MPSTIQFQTDLFSVSENVGTARIKVLRTGDLNISSLVNYDVEGGFALEEDDYTRVSGQLSFAPGETEKTVLVPITNNSILEGDETFSIKVFNPVNATLGPLNTSIIKIIDDDGTLSSGTLDISTASGLEAQRIAPTTSFDGPTGLKIGPSGEVFVVEKGGQVERIVNGVKQDTPFLDITEEVYSVGISQGLAGFALDPNFATNGHVYALYTTSSPTGVRYGQLSRFTLSAADPTRIDPSSQKILIGETPETGFPDGGDIHLVGDLKFGNDGTLLASYGDAAGNSITDDRALNSQNLDNLGGAIARIDPETGDGLSSNPFYTGNPKDNRSRIWTYGLRNPYRFEVADDGSTNPADGNPGTLYIGDVQRSRNEEINVARGGENFGWPYFEGNEVYRTDNPGINATAPSVFFDRGDSRSVIGGAIYQGDRYPEQYQGRYFEADYIYGVIRSWRLDENGNPVDQETIATGANGITDLEYDPVTERIYFTTLVQSGIFPGQLYALDVGTGGTLGRDTQQVSVGSDGTVWKLDSNDRIEQRTGNDWGGLPGALASVSVASDTNVWGVNAGGAIWQWDGSAWTGISQAGINVAVDEVSVGEDGAVWALGTDDSIWEWNGNNSWSRIQGALENVSVVDTNNVWGVNAGGDIWQWNGGAWSRISTAGISTPVSEIDAGADGTVIAIGTDDSIWQRNGSSWTQIPGGLEQVSVGSAGNIWGVNQGNEIYQYNGRRWTRVSPTDDTVIPEITKQVSVGSDGTVWNIGNDDRLEQRVGSGWQDLTGALSSVSVASDSNVWGVNAGGDIWQWDGNAWAGISQAGINTTVDEVSVGEDGTVWALGIDDSIWEWNGSNAWDPILGGLETVSVVNENNVWGSNAGGDIWQWDGDSWARISTAGITTTVSEVDAAADGTVWALGVDDSIWARSGASWSRVSGALEQVSVGSANNIWGVNSGGAVYQYDGTTWSFVQA